MSQLVAIVYNKRNTAEQAFEELKDLQKEYLIELEDIAFVTKNDKGKLKIHQGNNLAGAGAAGGAFWGLLIGMLFFAPFFGAAMGAAAGALGGAMSDYGIDDKFIKELSDSMKANNSALFVLFRKANPDKVVPQISKYGGKIIKTSLTTQAESKLQAELNHGAATL